MICPECGNKLYIKTSEKNDKTNDIYRKRHCKNCGYITYTIELISDDMDYVRDSLNFHCKKHKMERLDETLKEIESRRLAIKKERMERFDKLYGLR